MEMRWRWDGDEMEMRWRGSMRTGSRKPLLSSGPANKDFYNLAFLLLQGCAQWSTETESPRLWQKVWKEGDFEIPSPMPTYITINDRRRSTRPIFVMFIDRTPIDRIPMDRIARINRMPIGRMQNSNQSNSQLTEYLGDHSTNLAIHCTRATRHRSWRTGGE